jgi:hypothetical protein
MTALNDRFWARVLFKEFIKHYRKLTDEQIVADVRQSMDDLEELVDDTTSFGSQMVRWSMERAERYPQASENGKKGGRPRKDKDNTAGAPTREDGEYRKSRTPATISQDASTSNGEDDSKVPTSCTVSSKDPVVLNLAYSGEFGNVTLTQEQYNSLLQKFGNKTACDRAIDSLSAKLENGELKARSHYAVLVKWANYRNDKADERNDDGETYLEKNWRKALNNVGMNL